MSRRRPDGVLLSWRLTISEAPTGVLPFLIDWADSPHPAASLASGAALDRFEVSHPDPAFVRRVLDAMGEHPTWPAVIGGAAAAIAATVRLADGTALQL